MAAHIKGKLHFEKQGREGPVMLFIQGNPFDHRMWLYQTAHFSNWFRTVAVDLPSYGRSPVASPGLALGDMAQACWEVVDGLTKEPIIVVGNSVGGSIAVQMVGQRPDRISAAILTGHAYLPDRSFAREGGARWAERGVDARLDTFKWFTGSAVKDSRLRDYIHQLFLETNDRINVDSVRAIFTALEEPEPEVIYDRWRQPCLVIIGTEEPRFEDALNFKKRIPGVEIEVMEGAGHVPNLDDPAEWDRLALAFLDRHGLRRG